MNGLKARVSRLERARPTGASERVELWTQAAPADRYTCATRPGETRAAADFGAAPPPEGMTHVVLTGFAPKVRA